MPVGTHRQHRATGRPRGFRDPEQIFRALADTGCKRAQVDSCFECPFPDCGALSDGSTPKRETAYHERISPEEAQQIIANYQQSSATIAAKKAGIPARTLYRVLDKYKIERKRTHSGGRA